MPKEGLSPVASMEEREDREVEEAEWRGESTGDWAAVEGDETSVSTVAEVIVRRTAGCLAWALLEVVADAILCCNCLLGGKEAGCSWESLVW